MRRLLALTEDADFVCYRYRLAAFAPALTAGGWGLELWPRRRGLHDFAAMLRAIRAADAVVVQRRLFSAAKAWLIRRAARVLVFDFDDAIYSRDSNACRAAADPVRLVRFRRMVRLADVCLAGSEHLRRAATTGREDGRVHVMPTCVDPTRYRPAAHDRPAGAADLVWIGSPSTAASLADARPCLAAAAAAVPRLELHAMCDARERDCGLTARHSAWSAVTEADVLARADIGIAWLPDHPWSAGKCGLKVLQYMAAGLPVVANSIGIHRHLIDHGTTGFLADTPAEWQRAVATLAADPELRLAMGRAARRRLERHWSVQAWGPRLVAILDRVGGGRTNDIQRSAAA
ncbi:MAG: glycosyltransferase family 4 protein [Planctomycetaceae bacterium]